MNLLCTNRAQACWLMLSAIKMTIDEVILSHLFYSLGPSDACMCEKAIIGSDNGLSPGTFQVTKMHLKMPSAK